MNRRARALVVGLVFGLGAIACGSDDDAATTVLEDTPSTEGAATSEPSPVTDAVATTEPTSTTEPIPATEAARITTPTTEPCRAENAAPWLLELDDLEYTSVDRYKEKLPAHIDIEDMFPPGGAPMEYWVAGTEVMVAPDGSWYPGITFGTVVAEGASIRAAPCVAELVAEELTRRGVPIFDIVHTDGEPMILGPGPLHLEILDDESTR